MTGKRPGRFGSWGSPITADVVVAEAVKLSEPRLDGDRVYWIEGRPSDQGRYVVVERSPDGTLRDVTPEGSGVRSTVHSYGGGAYEIRGGVVYFVNYRDQQIYRCGSIAWR